MEIGSNGGDVRLKMEMGCNKVPILSDIKLGKYYYIFAHYFYPTKTESVDHQGRLLSWRPETSNHSSVDRVAERI